jgi:hypothetical protein
MASPRSNWLDLAHKRLDEAVFAAYEWKSDLSDEEILEKLLAFGSLRSPALRCRSAAHTCPGGRCQGVLLPECCANLERSR